MNNTKIPFYILELPESAKNEIRQEYGSTKLAENIIKMYNDHLKYRSYRKRSIYDYEVICSRWFKKAVKSPKVSKPKELSRWMETRIFKKGTHFSKTEAKHYRFTAEFLRKHELVVRKIYRDSPERDNENYCPTNLEKITNQNIDRIELDLQLLSMSQNEIVSTFSDAANDRFRKRSRIKEDAVYVFSKRSDFEIKYRLEDYDLYRSIESRLGPFRLYNDLVLFKYGNRLSKVNDTNNRLDHRLLDLPKECLRYFKVDGEPLVEIDLKNSQPCLLMNLLFGSLEVPFEEFYDVLDRMNIDYISLKDLYETDADMKGLVNSAFTGTFYETIQDLSNEEITREDAKNATMNVLFSGFKSDWNPAKVIWLENWKEFYWFIQNLKKGYFKALKDGVLTKNSQEDISIQKSPYEASVSFLPVLLQKIEAILFIDNILNDLCNQGLFAIPKHDAILCKLSEMDKVKKIMEDNLNKLLGYNRYKLDVTILNQDANKIYNKTITIIIIIISMIIFYLCKYQSFGRMMLSHYLNCF